MRGYWTIEPEVWADFLQSKPQASKWRYTPTVAELEPT